MGGRIIVVLLVIATLLPWRIALACSHEASFVQQRHCCCLEMRSACPHVESGVGPCCTAVVAAPSQLADAESQTLMAPGGGTDVPPPLSVSAFRPRPQQEEPVSIPSALGPDASAGSQTWLRTGRLRL